MLEGLRADDGGLNNMLTYHVVPGEKYMALDLENGQMLTTEQTSLLPVNITGDEVTVGTAMLSKLTSSQVMALYMGLVNYLSLKLSPNGSSF